MIGIVYHLLNKVNGKGYVGQTWMTLDERWTQHCRRDGDMLIQRAIRKHGSQSFERIVLAECVTQKDLDLWENTFMFTKGTMFPLGYNIREGGSHGRHSVDSRRKMSESHKGMQPANPFSIGHVPWNKGGGTFTLESRAKMAAAKRGKPRSEETRRKISERMKIVRSLQKQEKA